jgi:F420-non-reducing hydrogenase iron-sulfur subunit
MEKEFEPKIVGFFCNWCTAAAADLAGTSRIQYPANVRPIRVMCSGSVDASYVIKALLEGADGVLIGGCHPNDCHYVNGNYKARRRVALLKSIFSTLELDPERVWLRWISAAEGVRFAKVVRQMTEEIKEKGPNPMGSTPQT